MNAKISSMLLLTFLTSGCAVNRSYMQLAVPDRSIVVADAGKTAVIDQVTDQRHFEENPSDPSVPSLKKGDEYKLDAEQRKRAIARKRNGFGKAMGDILLDGDATVETLTRDLVKKEMEQRGYQVLEANQDGAVGAMHVSIDIREFWAWFTPGMWTVDMEAKINTVFRLAGTAGEQSISVAGYGKKSAPTGREDNWRQAYERAFEDYAVKLAQALDGAGVK